MRVLSAFLSILFLTNFAFAEEGVYSETENRFPETEPQFVKPPPPPGKDKAMVPHPNAVKGLIRIEKDGTYVYKTKDFTKTRSGSFRISSIDPPKITAVNGTVTFDSMYGKSKVSGAMFDYEWQPYTGFGRLGFQLGLGIYSARGNGTFKTATTQGGQQLINAEEVYNLYMLPVSFFSSYRFEYARHQLFVPFVNAGATYYLLAELRDDGKKRTLSSAPAIGGGGGVLISLAGFDSQKSFALGEEYGVSDLWLTVEARALKGLSSEKDFTSNGLNVGITVDY